MSVNHKNLDIAKLGGTVVSGAPFANPVYIPTAAELTPDPFRDFLGEGVRTWMAAHWEVPWLAVAAYMIMVLVIPKTFMKNRAPYNFALFNKLWNLFLTVFSISGAIVTVPALYNDYFRGHYSYFSRKAKTVRTIPSNVYHAACVFEEEIYYDGVTGVFVCAFILSKIPEMIDTFFLVFQKKRIIFLHWYHHITVMLYCWHAWVMHISSGLIFASMNYSVHSIMYFYYFMCSMGYRKLVRPFAPIITILQISQMVVGLWIQTYILYVTHVQKRPCDVVPSNAYYGFVMYLSYFILFGKLFIESYIIKPAPAAKKGEKPAKK